MNKFISVRIEPWSVIYKLLDALHSYVFRGQSNSEWPLSTSLERQLPLSGTPFRGAQNREYWMLHEFKRRFHLYSSHAPDLHDSVEWLAIMQHHGCATRLLDFTHSLFVAAYFAVVASETDASIWAINRTQLGGNVRTRFGLAYETLYALKDEINLLHLGLANEFVGHSSIQNCPDFVVPLEPKKCTERMSRQQGLFLMPTSPDRQFMRNLLAAFEIQEDMGVPQSVKIDQLDRQFWGGLDYDVMKFVIPKTEHKCVIDHLTKMNITSETLFPGLDGLARSLIQTEIRS